MERAKWNREQRLLSIICLRWSESVRTTPLERQRSLSTSRGEPGIRYGMVWYSDLEPDAAHSEDDGTF